MSISQTLTDKLNDVTLLRSIVKKESADSNNIFEVSNPANGDVVATLPQMTVAETSAIIEIAKQSQVS